MKALVLLFLVGCGPVPDCVFGAVEVFSSPFACEEVGEGLDAAMRVLQVPFPGAELPAGRIDFSDARFLPEHSTPVLGVQGVAWCTPNSMVLGNGALRTHTSAMAHEVAHWLSSCGYFDTAGVNDGHLQWRERGIEAALRQWSLGN